MKNIFLLILFSSAFFNGQIGIKTTMPQTTFHLDGAKDNGTETPPTIAHQANDVVITPNGNIGVGTISTATRLDIENGTGNGAIKIVDGTQAEGRVLTSDPNGVGTWKTVTQNNGTLIINTVPVTTRYIPNSPFIRVEASSISSAIWQKVSQGKGNCYCHAWNSTVVGQDYIHRTTIWALGDNYNNNYGLFFNDVYLGAFDANAVKPWYNQSIRPVLPDRLSIWCL